MRLSNLTGYPVLSTTDARELGRIDTVVIDPQSGLVTSYRLSGGNWLIPAEDAASLGADALMVDNAEVIVEPRDDVESRAVEHNLQIIGERALSDHGDELGTVADLEFDPETQEIESLSIGSRTVPGADLIGIGTYAVVVRDQDNEADQRR
jgi:sporulation protein YlmC with PRC-barrel domain